MEDYISDLTNNILSANQKMSEFDLLNIKNEIEKITPLEYYKMGYIDKLMISLKLANLQHFNMIDSVVEILNKLESSEIKIKWIAQKDNDILYFKDRKEVGDKFNIKYTKITTDLNGSEILDGYNIKRVNIKQIIDCNNNVLDIKESKVYD